MLFASPATAKVPSNAELHQMIVGVMQKMETLQSENRTLKKRLASLRQGKTYASVGPTAVPASVRREPSLIKAVVRNVKQAPQVATDGAQVEMAKPSQTERKPSKYYAALNLEYAIPENVSVESNGQTGDASLADGIGFGLSVGHRYNDRFRTDIELSRRSFELQNITSTSGGSNRALSGQIDIYTALLNGYYNLPNSTDLAILNSPVRPYIGVGIGGAYLSANDAAASLDSINAFTASPQTTTPSDASILLPAGHITAGLSFPISNKLDFDLAYRYFLMGDIAGTVEGQSGDSSVLRSHSLKLGMRYDLN
jgi:opacity protein-like surface antigen